MRIQIEKDINCLTVGQFQRAVPILNALTEDNMTELIPIFTDAVPEALDMRARGIIYSKFREINYSLSTGYTTVILSAYTLQDMGEMTLGEYIDLKALYKDIVPNMHLIVATLYRKKRGYRSEKVAGRAAAVASGVTVGEVAGVIQAFNDFDASLMGLALPNRYGYEEEPDPDDPMAQHIKRWGFYITVDSLAGGDILKYRKALALRVRDVFIHFTFRELDSKVRNRA